MRHWVKQTDDWINEHRPWALLLTVLSTLAVVALVNWASGSDLFRQFFFPRSCDPQDLEKCDPLDWKELFQAGILVLGLPVAFMLWHWRDRNVRDQIDAQRKDINLKEFQEVQLRAVGVSGEEAQSDAKHILQIAALHQLRGFLKGDFGPAFKRPAFETYCALLSRCDTSEWEAGDEQSNLLPHEIFKAVRSIVFEDWKWFFWKDYSQRDPWPLAGRSLHRIKLPPGADLSGLDLSRVSFHRSELDLVNFEDCKCWDVKFTACSLRNANLLRCDCEDASFDESDLAGVTANWINMSGASLRQVKFHAASMSSANFYQAKGSGCEFVNTTLSNANFNASYFQGVTFENSNLHNATFVSARVLEGKISGANLNGCDLSYAYLDGFYPSSAASCEGVTLNLRTRVPHPEIGLAEGLLTDEISEAYKWWIGLGANLIDEGREPKVSEREDAHIRTMRKMRDALQVNKFG